MPDFLTKEQRSSLMSRIRSRDTKIELKMKSALEANRIDFIYHPRMFGNPDFLIPPKITLFCDSSFWHGRNWKVQKEKLKKGYWQEHIARNRKRDRKVNMTLKKEGFVVLRCWNDEIQKSPDTCIKKIQTELLREKNLQGN